MTDTTTTQNLSSTRAIEFTVDGILTMAWHTARMVNVRQEPDANEKEWARKWLMMKMDSLQARVRIARSVVLEDVTLDASTGTDGQPFTVALSKDIWDVIDDAKIIGTSEKDETIVQMITRDRWEAITRKDSDGLPTKFYVDKKEQLTLYVWPKPNVDYTLRIQAVKWLRTAASTAHTLDLERYFTEYLVNALAYEIAKANSIDLNYVTLLRGDADRLLNLALGASKQRGKVQLILKHRR